MAHGFVYVLGNESMPGIYKIGMTLNHPKERVAQLSAATACPTPFDLLAVIGCEDPRWTEMEIHKNLDAYRVNASREFFRVHPEVIQDQLRQYGDPSGDIFWDGPLDWKIDKSHMAEQREWPVQYFLEQSADPIDWAPTHWGFD